jgi:hypothetical protein
MMMILGMFVFSIPTATYQSLQRSTAWNHASNSRVGSMPAYQYVGKGRHHHTGRFNCSRVWPAAINYCIACDGGHRQVLSPHCG